MTPPGTIRVNNAKTAKCLIQQNLIRASWQSTGVSALVWVKVGGSDTVRSRVRYRFRDFRCCGIKRCGVNVAVLIGNCTIIISNLTSVWVS